MSVDTKTVENRRQVKYSSYDDLLDDAKRLASGPTKTIGNWSFPQIVKHLGISLEGSIDGIDAKAPLPMRIVAKLFMKTKLLNNPLSPGFQIPSNIKSKFYPPDSTTVEEALDHLQRGVARCKSESQRASHPLFDHLSREEWDLFSLRHAEMHMSFVMPQDAS